METAYRTCPLCEATCGLELTLDGGRVTRVEGDLDDVFSQGYLCPKGAALGQLEHDPDRVREPLVRRGGALKPTSWGEAFAEVERRLLPLLDEHGRDSVAVYLGNANVHNLAGGLYAKPFLKALRTRNVFTASTVDQMPKHVACGYLYGDPLAIPVPDLDRTDYLLMLGANPRMSNGSLCTAPDFPGRLAALRRRGGRLVVVDPRRSRTAAKADVHLAVRPGGDAAFLLGLAHTLVAENLADLGRLERLVTGVEEVAAIVHRFPPERVAPACGLDPAAVRGVARDLAAAPRGVVYGRLGTTAVRYGTVASWLVDVCNVLTGNLDRPGGAMFPRAAHAHDRSGRKPFRTGRWTSRARGLDEVLGELPVATLADEIETTGAGQVRALITIGGNPVLSTPDGRRLDRAIAGLDLVIGIDFYRNATTRHADVLLPPPGALERSHYDVAFTALAVRNVANYSPPVLPLPRGRPDEWEILLRLAGIAAGQGADADLGALDEFVAAAVAGQVVASPRSPVAGRDPGELLAAVAHWRGPERLLDLLFRAGPYGDGFGAQAGGLTLDRLLEHPHGIDFGPLQPRLPDVLATASGTVELAPAPIVADVDCLDADLDRAPPEEGLVLVGRRHVRTNNSWMHNLPMLAKGELCTLQMHPDDARTRGLTDGATVEIRSRVGAVAAPLEVTDGLRPGVVSLPHGFGHDLDGIGQRVASRRPGANSNVLTDAAERDVPSGTAVLNGIPVEVAAVSASGTTTAHAVPPR